MSFFVLSDGNKGTYYTRGYGEGGRSWWSTGEVTPYEGQALDHSPEHNYIYLNVRQTRLFDEPDVSCCHFICETGECVTLNQIKIAK